LNQKRKMTAYRRYHTIRYAIFSCWEELTGSCQLNLPRRTKKTERVMKKTKNNNRLISSGDKTANVNFFTTTSSTTFKQCAPEATEFGEITQNKGHYAVQGHSRSAILVPIECSYDFLLVIRSKIAIFGHLSCV